MNHRAALVAALGLLAACGGPYGPEDVGADTLCITALDAEACLEGDDLAVARDTDDPDRLLVSGRATLAGAELGYETVDVDLVLDLSGPSPTLEAAVLPALVTCEVDIAHGDHCHLGIPSDRACGLPLGGEDVRRLTVDDSDPGELAIRFTATSPVEAPDCCAHTCPTSERPMSSLPPGPYTVHGALRVPLPAPEDPPEG